jgi:hypothetical protein|tara:strand:- start:1256 stop:1423 length:168 start_codon:yes stop_codon:yes gene_type:complete
MKTKTLIEDMSNEELIKLQEGHITLIRNSQEKLDQIAHVMEKRLNEPALLKTYDF